MITNFYAHILNENRKVKVTVQKFESTFYSKLNCEASILQESQKPKQDQHIDLSDLVERLFTSP